jgi:hypothetical protein
MMMTMRRSSPHSYVYKVYGAYPLHVVEGEIVNILDELGMQCEQIHVDPPNECVQVRMAQGWSADDLELFHDELDSLGGEWERYVG